MHAAKVAARERRTALVARAALTLRALGLIVFALVAGTRGPADAGQRVSEPIIAAPAPAPAPSTATPAAASQGADRGRRTTKSDRATGTAGGGGARGARAAPPAPPLTP